MKKPVTPPELTIERIFSEPELSGSPPVALRFAPDGQRITFLRASDDDVERLDLWQHDLVTGAHSCLVRSADLEHADRTLSEQEKANRERRRIFARGIVEYLWSPNGRDLIFPLDGQLYRVDLASPDAAVQALLPDAIDATDVAIAPDGERLSFVSGQNLHVVDRTGGGLRQLTRDGGGVISNGLAEFIAQEEMHRYNGHWWSPDGRRIAFMRVDESPIAISRRTEIDADEIRVVEQRYPYAGMENARVQLGVIDLDEAGAVRWLDPGDQDECYVPRITWLPDSGSLAVQIQSRDQKRLDLVLWDLASGERRPLLSETSVTWINLQQEPWFFKQAPRFILVSERSGVRHLYLHHVDGRLEGALTRGELPVHKLLHVDEAAGYCYFTAGIPTPTESHLYRAPLTPGATPPQRLTADPGTHLVEISANASHFIDRFSSAARPPAVFLRRVDGLGTAALFPNDPKEAHHPYAPYLSRHGVTRFGTLSAEDGQALHFRLTPPSLRRSGTRYPVVLQVYGGPGVQRVRNEWLPPWHQFLVRHGYGVLELDNRGSAERGTAFEAPIHNRLGEAEVADQLRAADMLREVPWADPDRIGVYGHSYGGYMTLMLMMKGGGRFRAGVAVAPVTDWHLYDTHYTERYLSHPRDNADGYRASGIFPWIEGLQGELMIMHGMADDNVLFTHTTKLIKALQDLNRKFTLMTYPGSKHGLAGRSVSIHRYETVDAFFARTLKGKHR